MLVEASCENTTSTHPHHISRICRSTDIILRLIWTMISYHRAHNRRDGVELKYSLRKEHLINTIICSYCIQRRLNPIPRNTSCRYSYTYSTKRKVSYNLITAHSRHNKSYKRPLHQGCQRQSLNVNPVNTEANMSPEQTPGNASPSERIWVCQSNITVPKQPYIAFLSAPI